MKNPIFSRSGPLGFNSRGLGVFVSLLFLLACSPSYQLSGSAEPGVNWSAFKTFALMPPDAQGTERDALANFLQTNPVISQSIREELARRGWTETDPGSADIHVNIGVKVDTRVQTRQTSVITDPPMYVGQRNYSWKSQEVPVSEYKQGSIFIDLVDRAANSRVWEGKIESVLSKNNEKRNERIRQAIRDLFAQKLKT